MKYKKILAAVIVILSLLIFIIFLINDNTGHSGDNRGRNRNNSAGMNHENDFGLFPFSNSAADKGKSKKEIMMDNRREIALMVERFPGNMWIPTELIGKTNKNLKFKIRKSYEIQIKINNGTASKKEQNLYYTFKIKSVKDKRDLIEYYMERMKQLGEERGEPFLSEEDLERGIESIKSLDSELEIYQKQMGDL